MAGPLALLAFFVLSLANHPQATTQDVRKPTPEIGWDSLQNRITYPVLPQRAGLEATVWAFLRFDSTGVVDSIRTRCMFEHDATVHVTPSEQSEIPSRIFSQCTRDALVGTKWLIPTSFSGWFSLRVQFLQSDSAASHRLLIEVNRIKLKIPPTY
jgi:hypothetical protein